MTNQSDRQADARSSTSTSLTYEGDSLAYFDSQGVPAGDYNGRLLAWINSALGTAYTEINGAKTALANNVGIPTWDGLNLLGRAGNSTPAPTAPVLAMDPTWDTTQSTVKYQIDAAWADQDDLQFERQATGGNWSGATVTHHTVTTSEIGGVLIDLGFGAVSNGTYDARCKFKHSGGSYSAYSNIVTFTVAAAGLATARISSAGNNRISSVGNNRKYA